MSQYYATLRYRRAPRYADMLHADADDADEMTWRHYADDAAMMLPRRYAYDKAITLMPAIVVITYYAMCLKIVAGRWWAYDRCYDVSCRRYDCRFTWSHYFSIR